MKLFHRTQLAPAVVLSAADAFFQRLGLSTSANAPRERTYSGPLGTVRVSAVAEGGHYTFVQSRATSPVRVASTRT